MTTTTRKRTRLRALKIATTSVVDHASSAVQVGGEGWLVCKADGTPVSPDVAAAIETLKKTAPPPETVRAAAPTPVMKSVAWAAIERAGRAFQETPEGVGLTKEVAIERVCDQQPELVQRYRSAEVDAPVAKAAPAPLPGSSFTDAHRAEAEKIVKASGCTMAQAMDLVDQQRPELRIGYYASIGDRRQVERLLGRPMS